MSKVKTLFLILVKILLFYAAKHPYITVWLSVWGACCTYKFLTTFSVFWIVWMGIIIMGLYIPYKIYVFLDEFSDYTAQRERRERKEKVQKELAAYLENEIEEL